jgi:hypothetical protein
VLLSACAGSGTGNRKYEDILIEQLSRGPISFSEFRKGMLAEAPNDATRYDMDNPDIDDASFAKAVAKRTELQTSIPIVWAAGRSVDDLKYVYSIRIHGAGWGGGDIKEIFTVYVGDDAMIIGWHATVPEWRARIEPHWR